MNNARIQCFGGYIPIRDIEVIDSKQQIWKGTRIVEPNTLQDVYKTVFFSRLYQPDTCEFDKLYTEKHFTSNDILDCEFWLIPKEKLLFGYDPPTAGILKPPLKLRKPGPGGLRL